LADARRTAVDAIEVLRFWREAHAERYRDIIGRFPHRNPLFLRETTAQEQACLDQGGFAGLAPFIQP